MDPIKASQLITDEYAAKILVATFRRPKSALELSYKLGIPIAACYRRIHSLEKAGLLAYVDKVLTQKGKRMAIYQSNLQNAHIYFEEGTIKMRFELKSDSSNVIEGEISILDLLND